MISIEKTFGVRFREIGGLVARAGADLEDLVGPPDGERVGHAGDRVWAGDGDAEADVEVVPFVGAVEVLGGDEVFAWGHQIGADVGLVPDVLVTDQLLEPVPALPEEPGILAAVPDHPFDEGLARPTRRRRGPVVGRRNAANAAPLSAAAAAPARKSRRYMGNIGFNCLSQRLRIPH